MKAVVDHGHEDFRVEHVVDPALQVGTDAVVRVTRTANCGSELHMWTGPTMPIPGFVMGHEVLEVNEGVGNVQILKKGPQEYIPRLLPLIEQGRLGPSETITHRLPLDQAIDGYKIFTNHEQNVLKVVLEP